MPTEMYLENIENKLDSLRTELMYIVSASRDSKELNEKIFQLSQKYKEPEILELIMYVNSSISIDLKQMKESLVKAVDTIVTIKKEHIRQIKTIDSRLKFLEKEYEDHWKGHYPTGAMCDIHTPEKIVEVKEVKEEVKETESNDALNILGMSLTTAKLKILGFIWVGVLLTFTFVYTLVAVNKQAAFDTVNIVKQSKEVVHPQPKPQTEGGN